MNLNHNSHFFQFSSFLSLLSQENFFLRVFYFFAYCYRFSDMLVLFYFFHFTIISFSFHLLCSISTHFCHFWVTSVFSDHFVHFWLTSFTFGALLFTAKLSFLRHIYVMFFILSHYAIPSSSPHFILSIHFYISQSIWWCEAHLVLSPV